MTKTIEEQIAEAREEHREIECFMAENGTQARLLARAASRLATLEAILANESARRSLVVGLERSGWKLVACEIDLVRGRARIEVESFGGLLVTLDAESHRASVTRERIGYETVLIGRRGDRMPSQRIRMEFIGRQRYEGPRAALRGLCNYLEDNAPIAALPRYSVRALVAPLMGVPS